MTYLEFKSKTRGARKSEKKMELKRETPESMDILAILREQITDTLLLLFHVQHAEANLRDQNTDVIDRLRSMYLELRTLSELVKRRAAACRSKLTSFKDTKTKLFLNDDEGGRLESLLNHFCRYDRNTSERIMAAHKWNDRETIVLLNQILSMVNTSISRLDVCSNAVWLKCPLPPLPKLRPASVLRQIGS